MDKNITEALTEHKKVVEFRPGDTVCVMVKIHEGDSERVQSFEGTVIGRRGSGLNETFTVRKISFGVGVERIFLVQSPNVEKIELIKSGKVRRAKLYYLRKLAGKSARIEELDKKDNPADKQDSPADKKASDGQAI